VEVLQQPDGGGVAIAHTWSDYAFTQNSDWINVFKVGTGTITIWESLGGGARGRHLYTLDKIPLIPGPLVVALKVANNQDPTKPSTYWPPNEPDQVEMITVSYVPPAGGSASASVRLFNLAPGVKSAGMTSSANSSVVISDVKYSMWGLPFTPRPT
jgi:hypothetical protein